MQHVSCNFNLRSRTATKPTIIYMVVYVGGKQYKISTGIKLLPNQWDFKRQTPKVSGLFSEEANRQSTLALRIINNYSFCFQEYFGYICNGNLDFEITELQTILRSEFVKSNLYHMTELLKQPLLQKASVNRMTSVNFQEAKRTPKGTRLVSKALETYLSKKKPKESTEKAYRYMVGAWRKWVEGTNQTDSMKLLGQTMVDKYEQYLIGSGMKGEGINTRINLLAKLINKYIRRKYSKLPEVIVDHEKAETVKPDESKRVELTDEEIAKLKNLVCQNERDEQYRNFFLLQLECGQRASDAWNLIHGEGIKKETEKEIVLHTEKNSNKSHITRTKEFDRLRQWFAEHPIKCGFNGFKNRTNKTLKEMAKEAGLDREIRYKDTTGDWKTYMLCDGISTHYARHTFATKMARKYDAETVAYMIGDTEKTVRKTYYHETDEDVTNKIRKAKEKAEATPTPTQAVSNKADEELFRLKQKDEWKMILTYLGYDAVDYCEIKDDDDFWRMIRDKELELEELGVNKGKLKNLYNGKEFNMKEKRNLLEDIALQLRKVHADDTLMPEQKESMKKDILSVIKDGA